MHLLHFLLLILLFPGPGDCGQIALQRLDQRRMAVEHPAVLAERLRALLADDSGNIRPELTVLHRTLVNTDRPRTVLKWLSRSSAAAVLGDQRVPRHAVIERSSRPGMTS